MKRIILAMLAMGAMAPLQAAVEEFCSSTVYWQWPSSWPSFTNYVGASSSGSVFTINGFSGPVVNPRCVIYYNYFYNTGTIGGVSASQLYYGLGDGTNVTMVPVGTEIPSSQVQYYQGDQTNLMAPVTCTGYSYSFSPQFCITTTFYGTVHAASIVLNTTGRNDLRPDYYHDFLSDTDGDGLPDSYVMGTIRHLQSQWNSDGSSIITFSTSDPSVGVMENNRIFRAKGPGTCTVTATCDSVSTSVQMTVLGGVALSPGTVSVTGSETLVDLKSRISAPSSTPTTVTVSPMGGGTISLVNPSAVFPDSDWGVIRIVPGLDLAGAFAAQVTDNYGQTSGLQTFYWGKSKSADAPQVDPWIIDGMAVFTLDPDSLTELAKVFGTPPKASRDPIVYATGEMQMEEEDLDATGSGGLVWRRSYSNLAAQEGSALGRAWMCDAQPFAHQDAGYVVVSIGADKQAAFSDSGGGVYTALRGSMAVLKAAGTDLAYGDVTGTRVLLYGFSATPQAIRGKTKCVFPPNGQRIDYAYDAKGTLSTITRRVAQNDSEQIGFRYNGDGLIERVERRRIQGSQTTVLRAAEYYYYSGATGDFGEKSDLKYTRVLDGSGAVLRQFYYRYYRSGDVGGFAGAMRVCVGPRNYARLKQLAGDPLTTAISYATLAIYADKSFTYDSLGRVASQTLQTSEVDGSGTYSYDYLARSTPPATPGSNDWMMRTTETLPGGAQNIVYTNKEGQIMLRARIASSGSTQRWVDAWRYNAQWSPEWHVTPSAFVASGSQWSESYTDLINLGGGNSEFIKDQDGLIERWSYYSTTDLGVGAVAGYPQYKYEQIGDGGALILKKTFTYRGHTQ